MSFVFAFRVFSICQRRWKEAVSRYVCVSSVIDDKQIKPLDQLPVPIHVHVDLHVATVIIIIIHV